MEKDHQISQFHRKCSEKAYKIMLEKTYEVLEHLRCNDKDFDYRECGRIACKSPPGFGANRIPAPKADRDPAPIPGTNAALNRQYRCNGSRRYRD